MEKKFYFVRYQYGVLDPVNEKTLCECCLPDLISSLDTINYDICRCPAHAECDDCGAKA